MDGMNTDEKNERRRSQYAFNLGLRERNYARKKAWVKRHQAKWVQLEREKYAREPFLRLVQKSRQRARESGIPNDLTMEWARARWNGHCEITGAEFKHTRNGKQNAFSPSLDKIDPTKGYVQDNCRFILCALNRFKGDQGDEVMMEIARMLVGH